MNPFYKYIRNRTTQYRKNFIQVITGAAGEGKSYCALSMAEEIDPTFSIERVCFTPSQFMQAIQSVKKSGQVIILDEMGVAMSSRKWASMSNILTNEVLQTFRYKHIVTFFVVPDFSFVDSQARKMAQVYSKVTRSGNDPARMWIYKISNNQEGKSYFKHPRFRINKRTIAMRTLTFKDYPSKELVAAYENKHKEFKEKLRHKNEKMLNMLEQDLLGEERTISDYAEEIIENLDSFKNDKGNLDWAIIAAEFGMSHIKAKQAKQLALKRVRDTTIQ